MRQVLLSLSVCVLFTCTAVAQTLPNNFSRVLVSDGLSSPTTFAFAPDGRILITEQGGTLRVIKNGSLLSDPALTLTVTSDGERGLIGVAVDPDFTRNQYIYLYYTVPAGRERTAAFNKIVRYTFNGDVINTASAQTVLELNDLSAAHTNHNGGALNFGPDSNLYVAVGENATGSNAQNLDNYLGKLLRIKPDGSVPAGNPFTGSDSKSRIWAYGLRNPYSFTFDRVTGKLFIDDVGESTWEEINAVPTGGLNFGWPSKEGFCTSGCDGFTDPIYEYGHADNIDGEGCAIVGGTVFNPTTTTYPLAYRGHYFFNDYCGKWINSIALSDPTKRNAFGTDLGGSPSYLVTGPDGNLYYLSRDDQALYKIVYNSGGNPPVITSQPADQDLYDGDEAEFAVVASGDGTITYQWIKNNEPIDGANQSTFNIFDVANPNDGEYSVLVSNEYGSVLSRVGALTTKEVTAITQAAANGTISVMPNPSSGKIKITYPTNDKRVQVSVRNAQGDEAIAVQEISLDEEIDLSSLPTGLYFLQINGYGVKVIKE